MASNVWPTFPVNELIRRGVLAINDGYRVRNIELGPAGIPFVRGGDIGDGDITTLVDDHIRPELANRVQSKLTRPFDIAFISKGTVGRVGMLRPGQPSCVFAPQVCYWRALDLEQLEPRYLFFLLRSHEFQSSLHAVKTHGSMAADYVSLADQRLFKLALPPITVQRRIAHILGTLDDKIELNRRLRRAVGGHEASLGYTWRRRRVDGFRAVGGHEASLGYTAARQLVRDGKAVGGHEASLGYTRITSLAPFSMAVGGHEASLGYTEARGRRSSPTAVGGHEASLGYTHAAPGVIVAGAVGGHEASLGYTVLASGTEYASAVGGHEASLGYTSG